MTLSLISNLRAISEAHSRMIISFRSAQFTAVTMKALMNISSGNYRVSETFAKIKKDVQKIIDCGYYTIIVTRRQLPKNSFAVMTIDAINDSAELHKLIELNLERALTKDEKKCFD